MNNNWNQNYGQMFGGARPLWGNAAKRGMGGGAPGPTNLPPNTYGITDPTPTPLMSAPEPMPGPMSMPSAGPQFGPMGGAISPQSALPAKSWMPGPGGALVGDPNMRFDEFTQTMAPMYGAGGAPAAPVPFGFNPQLPQPSTAPNRFAGLPGAPARAWWGGGKFKGNGVV